MLFPPWHDSVPSISPPPGSSSPFRQPHSHHHMLPDGSPPSQPHTSTEGGPRLEFSLALSPRASSAACSSESSSPSYLSVWLSSRDCGDDNIHDSGQNNCGGRRQSGKPLSPWEELLPGGVTVRQVGGRLGREPTPCGTAREWSGSLSTTTTTHKRRAPLNNAPPYVHACIGMLFPRYRAATATALLGC